MGTTTQRISTYGWSIDGVKVNTIVPVPAVPKGEALGVAGADGGYGINGFFTTASDASELTNLGPTFNANLIIPIPGFANEWPLYGFKIGGSYSSGKDSKGKFIWMGSLGGGAEFGPGGISRYPTLTIPGMFSLDKTFKFLQQCTKAIF